MMNVPYLVGLKNVLKTEAEAEAFLQEKKLLFSQNRMLC